MHNRLVSRIAEQLRCSVPTSLRAGTVGYLEPWAS